MRVVAGGVGYRNLCDHSFGMAVVDALADCVWPPGVTVEDLSYGPIAVVQHLEDVRRQGPLDRVVLVGAVERAGRQPGTLTAYRWDGALPDDEAVQTAITEAVTGVILLDNTLIIAQYFRVLPPDVVVVEVQPARHEFGDEMSAPVAGMLPRACEILAAAATEPSFARLPVLPLGGGAPRITGRVWPQVTDGWSSAR